MDGRKVGYGIWACFFVGMIGIVCCLQVTAYIFWMEKQGFLTKRFNHFLKENGYRAIGDGGDGEHHQEIESLLVYILRGRWAENASWGSDISEFDLLLIMPIDGAGILTVGNKSRL